jgi:membrane associated rhomboid family serine protease
MIAIILRMKAAFVILFWFAIQIWNVLVSSTESNVAWWAHIGGALTGAALVVVLRRDGVGLFECVPGAGKTIIAPWTRRS